MTDHEKAAFMAYAQHRAPGKRRVKPTAHLADPSFVDAERQLKTEEDDDDDDADFVANSSADSSGNDDDSESSSEGGSEDEDSEDDSQSSALVEEETGGHVHPSNDEDNALGRCCALCLNLRSVDAQDELIECDRCGLVVHESCYGVSDPPIDEASSTDSSASTEPWFCEPCTWGLKEPPYCELCPSRVGAFKRSDIGGRWVHLLCALYTPGMAFGDVDRLSAVSWLEIDSRLFGKKACALCQSPVDARCGLVVACEAGMCKSHFHVTCAQRIGTLVDHSDTHEHGAHNPTTPHDEQNTCPRYLTCKKHADPDAARVAKQAYSNWIRHEERRMLGIRRRMLDSREDERRLLQLERAKKVWKQLEGVTIAWPHKDKKRPRLIHASPQYVAEFAAKVDAHDPTSEAGKEFERAFVEAKGRLLPIMAPGFSHEFCDYYWHRQRNVLPNEQHRCEKLETLTSMLKNRLQDIEQTHVQLTHEAESSRSSAETAVDALREMASQLKSLGATVGDVAVLSSVTIAPKQSHPKSRPTNHVAAPTSSSTTEVVLKSCAECGKATGQHELVDCDTCRLFYHLKCLDPPLERMPKKTKTAGWECSKCAQSSDEDEDEEEGDERASSNRSSATPDSSDVRPNSRPQRNSAVVGRVRMAEERMAQQRDYTAAMQKTRRANGTRGGSFSPSKSSRRSRTPMSVDSASSSVVVIVHQNSSSLDLRSHSAARPPSQLSPSAPGSAKRVCLSQRDAPPNNKKTVSLSPPVTRRPSSSASSHVAHAIQQNGLSA